MRKLLLLVIAIITIVAVNAEPVSRQQALQKAKQFMPGKQFGEAKSYMRAKGHAGKEPFYIFNAKDKKGYVIVSGDDRTRPILCYADSGELDEDQMPDNMKWWLDNLASQIEALGTTLQPVAANSHRSGMAAIAPLIQTQWSQRAPYNYMCPDGDYHDKGDEGYNPNNLCVTGCVATAMAQVMYYWKWPKTCEAIDSYSLGYYDNGQYIEKGTVKGIPATTFKWDAMKTKYSYGETGEAADAVAELMRYCGQAVHMNYGVGSSGANVSSSDMAGVFNYSKNIRELGRDSYTTAQWEALVYEELSAEHPRPVLYSGRTSDVGHQFVVDGYDGDGLFHFNWGWGYSGSYSVLSLADPNSEHGVGGSANNGAFQYSQDALFGVKPAEPGEVMLPVLFASSLNDFYTQTYTRSGANADFTNVTLKAGIQSRYVFIPDAELDVQVGWGLFKDDQLVSCLASTTKTLPQRQRYSLTNELTMSFGKNLAVGKYQVSQIYRFSNSEAWKRCENYGVNSLVAEISATSLTVRKPDLDNGSFTVNSITTSEQPEAGFPMDIFLNVTNTGESTRVFLYLWMQKSGSSSWTNIALGNYNVDPGQTTDIKLSYTPIESGTYILKATDSSDPLSDGLCTATVEVATTERVIVDGIVYICAPLYKRATVIQNENADKNVASITIRQTVTASGVTCQVKAIAENAFKSYGNVSKIEIPEGVESIGIYSFSYMYNLKKAILPSTLKSIGDNAFFYNGSLTAIESHIAAPFDISVSVFASSYSWENSIGTYYPSPATLYVPIGTKSKYAVAQGWDMFAAVEEGELKEEFFGGLKYLYSTGSTEATVIQDDSYKELTEVSIPATATLGGNSYRVTAVGDNAFDGCNNLTSVTLPNGLVSIGKYAFESTGMKEVTFPATLKTIGEYAFCYCGQIRAVILPEGLESIGRNAFFNMQNLQKVLLPSSITAIGDRAFCNSQILSSVESHIAEPFDIPESVFASSFTWDQTSRSYIYSPSLATLYVPMGAKSKYAAAQGWNMFASVEEGELREVFFAGLKYTYSTGDNKATVIQDDRYQELTEASIPALVIFDNKAYYVTAIGNNAFMNCNKLASVTLPNGLVSIGKNAFRSTKIKEITFPATLKSIGENAFYYCSQIRNVILPEGLESIGRYSFYSISSLQKVILPSTLKSIGDCAFFYNGNLSSVESHIAEPFDISETVFARSSTRDNTSNTYIYSPSPATLYVPIGTKSKYEAAQGWSMFAAVEEGELKEEFFGVLKYSYSTGSKEATVIQDDGYQELTEVSIPATVKFDDESYHVTAIGNNAFMNCNNLTSVTLPNGLVSIGKNAFRSTKIKEITFPTALKSIGEYAFYYCSQIRTVILPEGLESIGSYSFNYVSNLKKVVLPSTLKSIGDNAFYRNSNLSSVESHIAEPFDISENVFAVSSTYDSASKTYIYSPSSATLYVPIGSKSKYAAAQGWDMFAAVEEGELKEEFFGILKYSYSTGDNKATVIQDDSYKELTEVSIPATATLGGKSYQVTAVGNNAFYGCSKLTSVTLPNGLVSIGKYSFYNIKVKEITFPSTLKSIGDNAFYYCGQISTVILPEGLESIGLSSFNSMSGLQKVILPSTLKSIGDRAFYYNGNLSSVESHIAEPFDISETVFASSSTWDEASKTYIYSPSSATLYVPIGAKSKYAAAQGWNMFAAVEEGEQKEGFFGDLKYAYSTGGTQATVIPDDSYQELTDVSIPATVTFDGKSYRVTAIANSTFRNYRNVISVTLPNGLVSIGNNAFRYTNIASISLPSTLRTIGESAFEDCYKVTSIVIPEGVEKIGHYAFYDMTKLERITLPSTLKEIGSCILQRDGKLTTVVSNISVPFAVNDDTFIYKSQWNSETKQYDYSPSPAKLLVPKGKVAIYQNTAGWNWFTGISELGDANGDGSVTITDAVGVVNKILGNASTDFNDLEADVNQDGKITITDAVGVVNIILNSGATSAPAMMVPEVEADDDEEETVEPE